MSQSSVNNPRLPVELLGEVFHRLIEEDEDQKTGFATDNILLVCKAWRDAALCLTGLWSRIDICIGHEKGRGAAYWLRYTKIRIKRAGLTQPLDIRFTSMRSYEWTYNPDSEGYSHFHDLLSTLTGHNGETAARWRSFHYSSHNRVSENIARRLFIFPTPSLQTLSATSINPSSLFPHTPLLTNLELYNCYSFCVPQISSIKSLTLRVGHPIDPTPLSDAANLTILRLTCRSNFKFPQNCVLRSLVEFEFAGDISAQSLGHFVVPNLRRLTVLVGYGGNYTRFAQSSGIPLEELEFFQFGWRGYIDDDTIREYLDGARTLLEKLSQLRILSFYHNPITELALKMLAEDTNLFPTPPREGHLSLMLGNMSSPAAYGTSRQQSIDEFRQMAGIGPEESWEALYKKFQYELDQECDYPGFGLFD